MVLGRNKKSKIIYLIDYGLAREYREPNSLLHIGERKSRDGFLGTVRFASCNVHLEIEPSRRDDLESLFYSIIYMAKGSLPWQADKLGLTSLKDSYAIGSHKLQKVLKVKSLATA